jgi:hypothetical protein
MDGVFEPVTNISDFGDEPVPEPDMMDEELNVEIEEQEPVKKENQIQEPQ